MTEAAANTLPWPDQSGRAETTDSETTPGGEEETRWVVRGVGNSAFSV